MGVFAQLLVVSPEPLSKLTWHLIQKNGITVHTLLKARLVRVELPGSIEVLITNLWEEDNHPAEEFKDLCFMRWSVETNISVQKNILQLESFSGLTVHSFFSIFMPL